ncbi:hypothetical protein P0136_00240 [Lentisphaerota bacterium ZTH]|nr:hypothetical protein JYG24_08615 [Lentisphaerota bacterium]WET06445.1 hypothetical protein P0136_00240 [Lentisphaerota bacterium ZTH]
MLAELENDFTWIFAFHFVYWIFILLFPFLLRAFAHAEKKPLSIKFAYIAFFLIFIVAQSFVFFIYWIWRTFSGPQLGLSHLSIVALLAAVIGSLIFVDRRPAK